MTYRDKIISSINLIKEYAPVADKYGGYKVMFSGGKDSQVMLDLFLKSGVNYSAYYNVTTNDPPENVYFIRKNYPGVIFIHPKQTFLQLIEKKGMLPCRQTRFCCAHLKEKSGKGFVAVGVRAEESNTRSKYIELEFSSKNPNSRIFDIWRMRANRKVIFRPLLKWREDEIWQYIDDNNIPVNPCYETRGRVGCIFCPYETKKELIWNKSHYPLFYRNLMKTIQKAMDNGKFKQFADVQQAWDWWVSKLSIEDYFNSKKQLELNF